MASQKPLSEQTIMNGYVFYKIMRDPKKLKPLLEFILKTKIQKLTLIEPEKTLKERFSSKGVRLDLYVEDDEGDVYDVDVQTTADGSLPLRMRYYQSMLDQTFFPVGLDYSTLRKSFVIFICDHDPFKQKRYIYTFQNRCDQDKNLLFGDRASKIVVNTKGTKGRIRKELKEILAYLDHGEVTGKFSRELDEAVQALKESEEGALEYMTWMTYGAEREAAGKFIRNVELIRGWYDDKSDLPMETMAKAIRVTIPQFENALTLIKTHPEMDDADIASRINWWMYK